MMKRTSVRLGPDEPTPLPPQNTAQIQPIGASNMHTLAQTAQPQVIGSSAAMLSVTGAGMTGFNRSAARGGAVINYMKSNPQQHPSHQAHQSHQSHQQSHQPQPAPAVQYAPKQPSQPPRHKMPTQTPGIPTQMPALGRQSPAPALPAGAQPAAQFQRLKVEDALSYLDQVKYRFNSQPQVYNDFLDIMKEFKSQTIDTPGVITRVSNLFKGHPELIVGFNTFLPPGYKIEVQSNGQVSVSMPSPTGMSSGGVLLGVPTHHQPQQLVHLLPVPQSVSSAGIVHNLSVSASPNNTLHHISQAHQQIEAAMHHHQQQSTTGTVQPGASSGGHPVPAGQPVEFNHAIEYVNKIKSRFSRQPDKYKRFLEILHAYQRGHRDVKEPQAKQQTEREVYAQVAKLFENQDDLLAEFGQFLPDAKAVTKPTQYPPHVRSPPLLASSQQRTEPEMEHYNTTASSPVNTHMPHNHHQVPKHTSAAPSNPTAQLPQQHHLKRSPSFSSSSQIGAPPAKKSRLSSCSIFSNALRDVSYSEAAKFGTLHDYNFFERAKKALKTQYVYDNFLRCLLLFTNEIISSSELLSVTAPFFCRHPDLHKWLQNFLQPMSPPHTPTASLHSGFNSTFERSNTLLNYDLEKSVDNIKNIKCEPIGPFGAQIRAERPQGDAAMDIDLTTCKRLGTSYCALPRDVAASKCSGRTPLCKEVLNDTWVSFPTWSEDSTFVTSRKTQYEEYIYRCEDERFELDVVIETNASTIRVLEGIQKKLTRMSSEEAARYRLDDCLGGHSPTIHQRALRRIYGDKVAVDIIAGLKKTPTVAVPVVLRRLKAKEEEWREAQKGFNKQWREQNEKYYLKSLDHQGINFKQNDLKAMRSKTLFNEVETAYAARKPGPHLVVDYELRGRQEAIKIVRDAAELLIHHARRQTGIQKTEKKRIKHLLRRFLPDLFAHPKQPLSDDEREEEEKCPDSPDDDKLDSDNISNCPVKQEKQDSSESDNASDKSGKNNKNDKENKPKNINNTDVKECSNTMFTSNNVKRSSSSEDIPLKIDIKTEIKSEVDEEDLRDYPPNEARFVCTSSWYLFLRLHGILCTRLGVAYRTAVSLAEQESSDHKQRNPNVAKALRLKPNNLPSDASSASEYYNVLLELVKGVLDGNTEASVYEDIVREMLGIKAYPAYTLDKIVSNAVRQLQHCVSESWSIKASDMAVQSMRGPLSYVRKAAKFLRQEHTAFLVRVYGGEDCKVTFELLEPATDGNNSPQHNHDGSRVSPTNRNRPNAPNGDAMSRLSEWSLYREQYSRPDVCSHQMSNNKPVFLKRNARAAGGYDMYRQNAACGESNSGSSGHHNTGSSNSHARRKPPRITDHSEAALSHTLRLLASRPHQLYRAGCLSSARDTQARLHARRRAKFRQWLDKHSPGK